MSITEYARHRGCDLKAVQYAVKTGRIQRGEDGRIESEQADKDWEKNTDHTRARYGPRRRNVRAEGVPSWAAQQHAQGEAAAFADPQRQAGATNFSQARAAREIYEARIKKLEFEQMQGNLVSRRGMEVAAYNRGRIIRDAMMNIPNRIAAQLAAETDPATVHEQLEAEIRTVLEEFAGGKLG